MRDLVPLGTSFPADEPLFKLVSVGSEGARISVPGGSFGGGLHTLALHEGHAVVLADGSLNARFVIQLIKMATGVRAATKDTQTFSAHTGHATAKATSRAKATSNAVKASGTARKASGTARKASVSSGKASTPTGKASTAAGSSASTRASSSWATRASASTGDSTSSSSATTSASKPPSAAPTGTQESVTTSAAWRD